MEEYCYARVLVEHAKKMAQSTLDSIYAERDSRRKTRIKEETNRRNWWRKKFFMRLLTVEEVEKVYEPSVWSAFYAWHTEDQMKGILEACERADEDYILVSADTLKYMS